MTPLGCGRAPFWQALLAGQSGVRRIQSFDPTALPTQIGAEILDFDAHKYLPKKECKRLNVMARATQLALTASQQAVTDAALDKEQLDPARFGVVLGSGVLPTVLSELRAAAQVSVLAHRPEVDLEKWGAQGLALIPPMWLLSHVPNMVTCHASILHNAQGPCNTIVQSDLGSLLALGEAYRAIVHNRADVFLAGGADALVGPLNLPRFCLFAPLSRRNDDPASACRPFDRKRDGQVLGEGAGVFVIEELEHAHRRGAPVLAEILGFATAFDRDRSGHGLARAIRASLTQADATPDDLDHVNAHGLSTVPADVWEAAGVSEVLGPGAPVFAAKSYFGNLGAGSCAVELAASLLALEHDQLPPTLNCEDPDSACAVSVRRVAGRVARPFVLKVGATELGQCAAVVCRRI
jgi:3-oxoacyl-[acyl-carrier-protein] synthase II